MSTIESAGAMMAAQKAIGQTKNAIKVMKMQHQQDQQMVGLIAEAADRGGQQAKAAGASHKGTQVDITV